MKKTIICLFLAVVMTGSTVLSVSADRKSDLQAQQAQAQAQLNSTNSTLSSLQEQQQQIQSQISEYNADIVDLMVQIDQAKQDIANTETKISDKQVEIEKTQSDLEDAEQDCEDQYQNMKARIKTIYETGGKLGWAGIVLNSTDITSMFNKAEYAQKLSAYDRDQLNKYTETVDKIADLKATLEEEKNALSEQKASLEAQEVALEQSEADLQTQLAAAEAQNSDYANQINEAKSFIEKQESNRKLKHTHTHVFRSTETDSIFR